MSNHLSSAEELLKQGKKNEAAKEIAAFQTSWDNNKMIMGTFIRHSELDTVNLAAAKLGPYLSAKEPEEFFAESESLRYQLHHIWETEKFNLDNVL